MRKLHFFILTVIVIISLVLLGGSLIHSYQLDHFPDSYTESILIPVEIISALLITVLNIINFIMIISSIIRKKGKMVLYSLLIGLASIILFISSLYIDAPTLLYMT